VTVLPLRIPGTIEVGAQPAVPAKPRFAHLAALLAAPLPPLSSEGDERAHDARLGEQRVTLTLEELAAICSSAMLTGVNLRRRHPEAEDDPDRVLAVWIRSLRRGEDAWPESRLLANFATSFRENNGACADWIRYCAELLGASR
jgi:hypothetical protein